MPPEGLALIPLLITAGLLGAGFTSIAYDSHPSPAAAGRVPSPTAPPTPVSVVPSVSTPGSDWAAYLHDAARSGFQTNASGINASNAASLQPVWSFATHGPIPTSPIVSGGTAYIGSWDGYEYALNAATGQLEWKVYLNRSYDPPCGFTYGITSSPSITGGTAYLGGGNSTWYALNASTGRILWSVPALNVSTTKYWLGYYDYASAVVYGGFEYIGLASECDTPLVQGGLLQVSLATHKVVAFLPTTSSKIRGASVWGTPSIDAATGRVYFTTGNLGTYGDSIVSVLASNISRGFQFWQVPANQSLPDGDFGATPTIFTNALGGHLVGAADKNGIFYAFNDSNLTAGPVWEDQVATSGACPECGDGSISPAAWDGTHLYVAGGKTTINGIHYPGSVREIDPNTGKYLWQHGAPGTVLGGLAAAGGVVAAASGQYLELLNATSGAPLLEFQADSNLYGAPSIAEGRLYFGSAGGIVYALGVAPNRTQGSWQNAFSMPPFMNASMAYDGHDGYALLFGGCAPSSCPSAQSWRWSQGAWSNLTPSTLTSTNNPSPRIDSAMTYDAADSEVVLFGGYAPGAGVLNDTWTFSGGVWKPWSGLVAPTARAGASITYDAADKEVVLFGGSSSVGGSHPILYNDTWTFKAGVWTPLLSLGPAVRVHAGLTFDPSANYTLLFGGTGTAGQAFSDSWKLSAGLWLPLVTAKSPSARSSPSIDFDTAHSKVLLFGGLTATGGFLSDTWTFSGGSWASVAVSPAPPARAGAPLVYDAATGYSFYFGGTGLGYKALSDQHSFSGTAWPALYPYAPGPVAYGASSAYDARDHYALFFGGHGKSGLLSATSSFASGTFGALAVGQPHPSARALAAMAYDYGDGYVLLFGGQGTHLLSDTWEFKGGAWTNVSKTVLGSPPARAGASLAYDPADGVLLLFGGVGGSGPLNDTWEYHNAAWTELVTSVAPAPREGAGLAYDSHSRALVLFGGNRGTLMLGDTWNFTGGDWTPVPTVGGPSARTFAGMTNVSQGADSVPFLVGGTSGSSNLSDAWDFSGGGWYQEIRGVAPSGREYAAVAYDPGLGMLVLHGGATGVGGASVNVLHDTWLFHVGNPLGIGLRPLGLAAVHSHGGLPIVSAHAGPAVAVARRP